MKQLVIAPNGHQSTQVKPVGDNSLPRADLQSCHANHDLMHDGTQALRPARESKDAATDATPANSTDPIESVQLERLAKALLSKDHQDLAALAASNPTLMEEWQRAFRRQHSAAKRSARYWASASAVLATAKGLSATSCKKRSTH